MHQSSVGANESKATTALANGSYCRETVTQNGCLVSIPQALSLRLVWCWN